MSAESPDAAADASEQPAGPTPVDKRQLREQAYFVVMAFLLVESLRGHSVERRRRDRESAIRLRDSLIYRGEAVEWHVSMMRLLRQSGNRRLAEVLHDKEREYHLLMLAGREQAYIFDDLIFNALALFDYTANFVGFAYYGDQRRKAKWDRIEHFARDNAYEVGRHPSARISTSPLGALVRSAHAELVYRLAEYRAEVIHYEARVGKGTYKWRYEDRGEGKVQPIADLRIRVPEGFSKHFTVPGHEAAPSKTPLLAAANWVRDESLRRSNEILRELERDLRREAGADPEGTDYRIEMV